MMTPKSSFTARRLGWAIYFNGYHKKETKRERKAQRNILMKTLGTSKNHAGCIGPIHSSNAWQRTGKKKKKLFLMAPKIQVSKHATMNLLI